MITDIEPQKKDKKRVSIYLDGKFSFGLSGNLATSLKIGQELSDEKISQLLNEDQFEKATQKALHFISYRPRSILEVRKKLKAKEIPYTIIEKVIEKLENNSLLSDEVFAKEWINDRNDFHPRSRLALRMELKVKGIPEEIIESSLENLDEDNLAYKAAKKYSNRLKKLELPLFRKKLSSFLARKGFAYSIIYPVVDKIWTEIQEESNQGELNFNKENSWTQ